MFLRVNKRFKDGKMHRYWSVVENRRIAGGSSVQKTLLYDLTSTYFEVDANGPVTEASRLKAFGYSRDKRPDCVQIVIALIITPDGLPIGYEVMRGNTSDKTTLGFTLPVQPPPEIRNPKPVVETF